MLSPGPNEPFFKPDVWVFPLQMMNETQQFKEGPGLELLPLFTTLCHPVEAIQIRWASLFFQSVALITRDITPLPVHEQPTNPTDELSAEISMIKYFIECLKGPSFSTQTTSASSSTSQLNDFKTNFSSLEKLIESIHQMLLAFAILKARSKMDKDTQTAEKYAGQFSTLPSEYVSRPHYMLLASFCVAGIRGLFTCPADPKAFGAAKCFLLISVVAKVNSIQPPPENLEPVWKRTNAYISSVFNSYFFSSGPFKPIRILRYKIAKYIVLDFCEHWLNSHPEGDHVMHVPRKCDCPKTTLERV